MFDQAVAIKMGKGPVPGKPGISAVSFFESWLFTQKGVWLENTIWNCAQPNPEANFRGVAVPRNHLGIRK